MAEIFLVAAFASHTRGEGKISPELLPVLAAAGVAGFCQCCWLLSRSCWGCWWLSSPGAAGCCCFSSCWLLLLPVLLELLAGALVRSPGCCSSSPEKRKGGGGRKEKRKNELNIFRVRFL
ncbi:hypothetical protein KY289_018373 [Solanum tuberosum]|nr:hypothetical protein KY289_018373 [Solanum tuberosum]